LNNCSENQEVELKGVSTDFYDATTKVLLPKKKLLEYLLENQDKILGDIENKNSQIIIKGINETLNNNNNEIIEEICNNKQGIKKKKNTLINENFSSNPLSRIEQSYNNLNNKNDKSNQDFKDEDKLRNSNKFPKNYFKNCNNIITDMINTDAVQITDMFENIKNNNDYEDCNISLNEGYSESIENLEYSFDENKDKAFRKNFINYKQKSSENNVEDTCSDLMLIKNSEFIARKRKNNSLKNKNCKNNEDLNLDKKEKLYHLNPIENENIFHMTNNYIYDDENYKNLEKRKIIRNNGPNTKRKKRKKFNYKKNSTIIEIKKIN